jgi:hypothetical protein
LRIDRDLHEQLIGLVRWRGGTLSSVAHDLIIHAVAIATEQEEEGEAAWRGRSDDPQLIAASMAWAHLAVDSGRTTRFVPPMPGRRGLVLLIDGVPSRSRAAVWNRVISEVEVRGYTVAARASAPNFGAYDGTVEVLAVFSGSQEDAVDFEAVWADAITVEEGV